MLGQIGYISKSSVPLMSTHLRGMHLGQRARTPSPWVGAHGSKSSLRLYAQDSNNGTGPGLPIAKRAPRRNLPSYLEDAEVFDDSRSYNGAIVRQTPVPAIEVSNAELKTYSMELQAKTQELADATRQINMLAEQVSRMQASLASERREVRDIRAQLLDAQQNLSTKDDEIRELYQTLLDATRERSELRKQLITTQQQLQRTEADLVSWTDGLYALKTVIDSMDDDDEADAAAASASRASRANGHLLAGGPDMDLAALPSTTELLSKQDESSHLLQQLAELSRAILEDSEKDDLYLAMIDRDTREH